MRTDEPAKALCFTCVHISNDICRCLHQTDTLVYAEVTDYGFRNWIDSCAGYDKDWVRILKYGEYKHRVFNKNGEYI